MKKLISAILLIVVFLNTFALIGVSAETTDKISFEEAEKLSFEAVRRYFSITKWEGYLEVDVNLYKGYFLFQGRNGDYFGSPFKEINPEPSFVLSVGGVELSYCKIEKLAEPFTGVADVDNYIKEIYAGKALEDFFLESKYVEKDGNIYVQYYGGEGWYGRSHRLLLCNNFVSNSDGKAVMNVVFGRYGGPAEDFVYMGVIPSLNTSYAKQRELLIPVNATVEFTKTEDGWRVSGGSLLEMISDPSTIPNDWDYKPYAGDTPFTGDETAIIIALLALSGIALAVLPRKRRKR